MQRVDRCLHGREGLGPRRGHPFTGGTIDRVIVDVSGGRRPNGDIPMLRFARTDARPALRLLVVHDDAEREFAYTQGAEQALGRAGEGAGRPSA